MKSQIRNCVKSSLNSYFTEYIHQPSAFSLSCFHIRLHLPPPVFYLLSSVFNLLSPFFLLPFTLCSLSVGRIYHLRTERMIAWIRDCNMIGDVIEVSVHIVRTVLFLPLFLFRIFVLVHSNVNHGVSYHTDILQQTYTTNCGRLWYLWYSKVLCSFRAKLPEGDLWIASAESGKVLVNPQLQAA